jgi:hypothetical protein
MAIHRIQFVGEVSVGADKKIMILQEKGNMQVVKVILSVGY